MGPTGPFNHVTVNTAPDRARRLIGRVVEDVKDQYTIIHAANAASIDEVRKTVEETRPDVLVSTVPPIPFGL
jgi:mRNA degradation ribonuclease J1/J2